MVFTLYEHVFYRYLEDDMTRVSVDENLSFRSSI